jgi:hypothetical protein
MQSPASDPFLDLSMPASTMRTLQPVLMPPMAPRGPALHGQKTTRSPTRVPSSDNPYINFFFQVVVDTLAQPVCKLVTIAWAHNPVTALKLIANLRGVPRASLTGRASMPPRSECMSAIPRRSHVTFPCAHGQSVVPQPAAGDPVLANFSAPCSPSPRRSPGDASREAGAFMSFGVVFCRKKQGSRSLPAYT